MSVDNIVPINCSDGDRIDMLDHIINNMYDTCLRDKSYMMYVIQSYWRRNVRACILIQDATSDKINCY